MNDREIAVAFCILVANNVIYEEEDIKKVNRILVDQTTNKIFGVPNDYADAREQVNKEARHLMGKLRQKVSAFVAEVN